MYHKLVCHHRFVRREKEIAESRFEVAQGESLRYRLRVEHLERELKEVQDSLCATKSRMQVCFLLELTLQLPTMLFTTTAFQGKAVVLQV